MKHYLLILFGSAFANNLVLTQFLGLCPLMGSSRRQETALRLGLATVFVLTLTSVLSHLIDQSILEPLGVGYLRTIVCIVVIAAVVQFTEQVIRARSPRLFEVLGIYLPLITTNCAVLGVALLNVHHQYSFWESLVFGLGASLGFTLVLVLFAGHREKLEGADVPMAFRGSAIGLITAGLAAIAFMGLQGFIRT